MLQVTVMAGNGAQSLKWLNTLYRGIEYIQPDKFKQNAADRITNLVPGEGDHLLTSNPNFSYEI
jgi:hypothetical protein